MKFNRRNRVSTSRSDLYLGIICCTVTLSLAASSIAEELPEPSNGRASRDSARNEEQDINVVAHWRFQKGIAGSKAASSQLIEDASRNSQHGRAIGGPQYHAAELPTTNLALAFDGNDDRISIADGPKFYLTKSFTIEAWIEIAFYPGSHQNRSFIIFRGDDRAGFDPWFLSLAESGQLEFLVADSLNNGSVLRSPEPLPTRKFLHVAAVLDDETGKQSLYVDGKRVASTKTKIRAGGPLGGTRPGIGIGGRQDHSHQGYRGSIAELRITAEALAPSQFLRLQ